MKKIILICLLALFSTNAFAENCSVSERKLAIYFSNGMFNDQNDARSSLKALMDTTVPHLQAQGYTLNYDIAYNQNEEWYYQILEVFRQRELEEWSLFYRWLSALEVAPDWFQEAMKSTTQSIESYNYVVDEDLQNHIAKYKSEIQSCKRLLIVAHSQGNFYANSAWDAIYQGKIDSEKYYMNRFPNIGLFSVATPAGHVGDWLLTLDDHKPITRYVTSSNDWVINAVRALGYTVLPATHTNTHDDADWKHHSFADSYLNGDVTGSVLTQGIQDIVGRLETLPFDRTALESSSLKSVGYLPESKILEAEFVSDGSIYRYYDVPQTTYDGLMAADSHGSYFYSNIRTSFTYKKVYDGI